MTAYIATSHCLDTRPQPPHTPSIHIIIIGGEWDTKVNYSKLCYEQCYQHFHFEPIHSASLYVIDDFLALLHYHVIVTIMVDVESPNLSHRLHRPGRRLSTAQLWALGR